MSSKYGDGDGDSDGDGDGESWCYIQGRDRENLVTGTCI